jgi:hypothetical protein
MADVGVALNEACGLSRRAAALAMGVLFETCQLIGTWTRLGTWRAAIAAILNLRSFSLTAPDVARTYISPRSSLAATSF